MIYVGKPPQSEELNPQDGSLQASTIINKWQGVFSRISRGLHQQQHIHHNATRHLQQQQPPLPKYQEELLWIREYTDPVPFDN
jgi:hypothetical protein